MDDSKVKVNGIQPKNISFAPETTGHTPTKSMKRKVDNGLVDEVIEQRWANCQGRPARIHKFEARPNGRQDRHFEYCCLCRKKTSWYCIGCKSWFCMTATEKKGKLKADGLIAVDMNVKDWQKNKRTKVHTEQLRISETEYFERSCFIQKHETAWNKQHGN